MDAFTAALDAMDLEAMIPLLDQDTQHFSFRFREQDVENLSLPTEYLNRGDLISVWRNIFSGDEILNHAGEWVPLNIEGNLEVRVRPPSSAALYADEGAEFALFDMVDGSWDGDSDHQVSLGEFLYSYFTNDAPVAFLTDVSSEDSHLLVEASTCASKEAPGGLFPSQG